MIDLSTNDINQIAQQVAATQVAAQQIKETISPWLPALAIAAGWAGREINRFCAAARTGAEWTMQHGGITKIIGKLFWNPPPKAPVPSEDLRSSASSAVKN